ncbi:HIT domain-containing protein [Candidatus Woesearchaeota archaeon]|nr:HIT domain-containing protein [Candidatus Woesearchaeota archaeon]
MMMQDCIFCKIVNGEIPCSKIYEDEKVLAFLDISPINKGHVLLIPKEHHKDLFDTPDDTLAAFAKTAKKIAKAIEQATDADGINLGQNNGKAAGQEVFHAHIHIIPRFSDDGLKHWPGGKYKEGEEKEFAEKIRSKL